MHRKWIVSLLVVSFFLAGCPIKPEKARDGIALAYGFIGDLQQRHLDSCQKDNTQTICVAINRGIAIQRTAAEALHNYCSGTPNPGDLPYLQGGPCSINSGYETRLSAALEDLNRIMSDLKKIKTPVGGR